MCVGGSGGANPFKFGLKVKVFRLLPVIEGTFANRPPQSEIQWVEFVNANKNDLFYIIKLKIPQNIMLILELSNTDSTGGREKGARSLEKRESCFRHLIKLAGKEIKLRFTGESAECN